MSVTNLEVISRALRELNVIAEGKTASAAQGAQCIEKLNDMMLMWEINDIDYGWFAQSDTSDDCPIPDYAILGVTTNLGVVCASQYGATVSAEHATVADRTYRMLHRKALQEQLDNTSMTHMPQGSGHYHHGSRYQIATDS